VPSIWFALAAFAVSTAAASFLPLTAKIPEQNSRTAAQASLR
jgi:hypothetical protein